MKSDYHVFWIDKYVNGYRKGCTHAANSNCDSTLCGIDMVSKDFDGGYDTTETSEVECLRCKGVLLKESIN